MFILCLTRRRKMSVAKSIGTASAVRGCKICTAWRTPHYLLLTTHYFCPPSPAELVPSPYEQGESAVRNYIPRVATTTYYLLLTTYYLLPTTYNFPPHPFWRKIVTVSSFIFRHFSLKTLTNINIPPTRCCNNIYLRCQNK